MKPCSLLQILFALLSPALMAQTTLEDLPKQPASLFRDAMKLSRDLEKLRAQGEWRTMKGAPFSLRPSLISPRPTPFAQSSAPNDLVIGQTNPNEVVTITGNYVLPGNLIILNNGVLNLNNANFQIAGDITIVGNGQLNTTGGSFTVLQEYVYEHGAQILQKGRCHFNGVKFSSSGQSWAINASDSAQYVFENSKVTDGFITAAFFGRAGGTITNTKTAGEFLCFGENELQFRGCDFLVQWLVLFDSSAVDISLPGGASVNGWRFSNAEPSVAGVPYSVAIDSCSNVNWGLISYSGSEATFRNTHLRVAGLLFTEPDSIVAQNITNGSRHADEVIAAPDRKLRLINSEVDTWSFYPFSHSNVTIRNCVFGEMIAQENARVLIDNSVCDGSGGYVGAFGQSFTVIFRSLVSSQVISRENAILVGALSAFNGTEIDADESSIMVILNTATLVEPQAHTAAIIFEGQLPPAEGRTESMVALMGTVRLLAGPLNPIRLTAYKVEYAKDAAPPLWQPTDGLHAQAVVNDTLALWNTARLQPGPYALRLTMYHSLGDSLSFDSFARLEQVITGVESRAESVPQYFALEQNYPNPFNPATVISFQLPANSHVTLKVFDVNGREVARLIEGKMNAGYHNVTFTPRDLAGGIYFYQLTAGKFSQMRKAILVK
ncbi:MAG: T9SS type A sorting domain-containing protein [candidate division KSB1 bacterium]|nr:T9SS type A sorting domain-containing protein [candidate division KSB1 bacterium]